RIGVGDDGPVPFPGYPGSHVGGADDGTSAGCPSGSHQSQFCLLSLLVVPHIADVDVEPVVEGVRRGAIPDELDQLAELDGRHSPATSPSMAWTIRSTPRPSTWRRDRLAISSRRFSSLATCLRVVAMVESGT